MKLRFVHILLLMLLLATEARSENLGYTSDHPLLFGLDMDYAPMQSVDDKGKPHGFDVEFTERLLKRLDIPFKYSPNTWENIAGDVLHGRVDLGMMVYSPYRKNLTNYSRAVFRLYYQIVYRKEEAFSRGLRDVEGKAIALMASRPVEDTLRKSGAIIHVVKDLRRTFAELSRGDYDAVICFRYQAHHIIEQLHLTNLTSEDLAMMPREYCYVSHNKELIDAINTELKKMEDDGTIEEVYANVKSSFGRRVIPHWVWYLMAALVIFSLIVVVILQRQSRRRIFKEMERAQRSEKLKTVFLGNVSHALRTPLNSIIGFSDVMREAKEGELTHEEQQQMLKLINQNGRQLLYFIDELLQLSNFEGNELLFERSEVDLEVAMEEMAALTRQKVAPGVEVKVVGDGGHAIIDKKLMHLVTMHALDNAARHTLKGSIILAYRRDHGGLRIDVKDTGPGLPKELKENIFTLLSDKNTFVQDEIPGLGLSICKAVVQRSGGRIGVESPPDGGTLLWHWVPVEVRK